MKKMGVDIAFELYTKEEEENLERDKSIHNGINLTTG
jgi:hypothetical protein